MSCECDQKSQHGFLVIKKGPVFCRLFWRRLRSRAARRLHPLPNATAASRMPPNKSTTPYKDRSHDCRQQNVLGNVVDHRASAATPRDFVVLIWQPIGNRPPPRANRASAFHRVGTF